MSRTEVDSTLTPPPSAIPPAPRKPKRHEAEAQVDAPPAITLETLLADATVTAIVIVPGAPIEVERGGKMENAGELGDRNAIAEAVWQLATTATPPPPGDNPVVDVRLTDGTADILRAVSARHRRAGLRRHPQASAAAEASLAELSGGGDVEKLLTVAAGEPAQPAAGR